MARHNDIDRASALLEGVQGWSIKSFSRSGGTKFNPQKANNSTTRKRKDKRRCSNYNKHNGKCYKLKCTCMGSSDCASYSE